MSEAIITVENLGKMYRLRTGGRRDGRYTTLRDVIAQRAKSLFRRNGTSQLSAFSSQLSNEDFWALRHVSFEVQQGEVVGIIGRNGAGKSTLLKILSRITDPTEGRVRIRGRVASLLEVGTGFHPELTGRENVYLNGAILGMTRAEIKSRFDEIVSFAEVEKFLDTPVKRYSSGMYVRLAFAVAAHLDPEILIVDEVLAVGDAEFQKKCLGKMHEVAHGHGRTILFVSHNLAAVESLCSRAIVLDRGKLIAEGIVSRCVSDYLALAAGQIDTSVRERHDREGRGKVRIEAFDVSAPEGIATGKPVSFRIKFKSAADTPIDEFGISVWSDRDVRLISISTKFNDEISEIPQSGWAECTIPSLPLVEGSYVVNAFVSSNDGLEDYLLRLARLTVATGHFFGTGRSVDPAWGMIAVQHSWRILEASETDVYPRDSGSVAPVTKHHSDAGDHSKMMPGNL